MQNFLMGENDKMTITEAHRILKTHRSDSPKDIRKNYLRLMKENHPDNRNSRAAVDARLLNEAYHLIISLEGSSAGEEDWDADIEEAAFCARTVYIQHTFDDGTAHAISMANGKYLWNPEAEDFPMLMKSVYEAAHDLAKREDPVIFHFLMQEFVDPIYALEKMQKPWSFRCKTSVRRGHVISCSSKLYACAEREKSEISFRDKSLYYVVTPLIMNGSAVAEVVEGIMQVSLTDKPFRRDFNAANAAIS